MAIADPPVRAGNAANGIEAVLSLLSAIRKVPTVEQVQYDFTGGLLELWVLVSEERPEDLDTIALLDREYRRSLDVIPLEVHVLPSKEVDQGTIPNLPVL